MGWSGGAMPADELERRHALTRMTKHQWLLMTSSSSPHLYPVATLLFLFIWNCLGVSVVLGQVSPGSLLSNDINNITSIVTVLDNEPPTADVMVLVDWAQVDGGRLGGEFNIFVTIYNAGPVISPNVLLTKRSTTRTSAPPTPTPRSCARAAAPARAPATTIIGRWTMPTASSPPSRPPPGAHRREQETLRPPRTTPGRHRGGRQQIRHRRKSGGLRDRRHPSPPGRAGRQVKELWRRITLPGPVWPG